MNCRLMRLCASFTLVAASAASAVPFTDVYIVGDSLSDSGNLSIAAADAAAALPPGSVPEIPPVPPYFDGRFSNGPNFADLVAARLGFSAEPSLLGGNNYAYGGARTDNHPFDTLGGRDMLQQKDALLADNPGGLDGDALYIVFGGSNDLQNVLLFDEDPAVIIPNAVSNLFTILSDLAAEGAQRFLVPNGPSLSRVPRILELEVFIPGITTLADALSTTFNALLDDMLIDFGETAPGVEIVRFDVYGLLEEVANEPSAFNFTNATDRCFTGDDFDFAPPTLPDDVCDDPSSYLFWDGIHPSARGHQILAERALAALGIVPVPGTAVLLLLGLMGMQLVRRAKSLAFLSLVLERICKLHRLVQG